MKNSLIWIVVLFMIAALQMCTDEGEFLVPEKIQFTVTLPVGYDAGRQQASEDPSGCY